MSRQTIDARYTVACITTLRHGPVATPATAMTHVNLASKRDKPRRRGSVVAATVTGIVVAVAGAGFAVGWLA